MNDGWYPDPTRRFAERYVLRGEWSALVRTGEQESIDSPPGLPSLRGSLTGVLPPAPVSGAAPGLTVPAPAPAAAQPMPSAGAFAGTSPAPGAADLDDWSPVARPTLTPTSAPSRPALTPTAVPVTNLFSQDRPVTTWPLRPDELDEPAGPGPQPPAADLEAPRWHQPVALALAVGLFAAPLALGRVLGGVAGPAARPWVWWAVAALALSLAARRATARGTMAIEVEATVPEPVIAGARPMAVPTGLVQHPTMTDRDDIDDGGGRRVLRSVAGLVVMALVGSGVVLAYHRVSGGGGDSPWASTWDPAIEPVARFVEGQRGLTFTDPVRVEYLDEQAFLEWLGVGDAAPSDPTHRSLLATAGLIEPGDVLDGANDALAGSVVGFYSHQDKVIRVRGSNLTPAMYVTLAHELTHALQDQHFDLTAITNAAAASGNLNAVQAVLEGDAVLVERAYQATLSSQEQSQLEAANEGAASESSTVPRLLSLLQGSPYVFGDWFVTSVMATGVPRDDLFRRLPATELEVLDPGLYAAGVAPVAVPTPTLAPGEVALPTQFEWTGMLAWYLALGERVGAGPAWEATRGWRGSSSVSFTAGDARVCQRTSVAFESDLRAQLFAFAVAAAVAPTSVGASSPTQVDVTICDGDVWQPMGSPDTDSLVWVPFLHYEVSTAMVQAGYPADMAGCVADRAIGRPDAFEALRNEDAAAYQALLPSLVASCP